MTKIEITDAMVQRCRAWFVREFGRDHCIDTTRAMLHAALNPPPEPEITVTREMSIAGARAYNEYLMVNHQPVKPEEMAFVGGVAAAYRAMRALEPKPVAAHDDGTVFTSRGPAHMHRRGGDTSRDTYLHRREADPK